MTTLDSLNAINDLARQARGHHDHHDALDVFRCLTRIMETAQAARAELRQAIEGKMEETGFDSSEAPIR